MESGGAKEERRVDLEPRDFSTRTVCDLKEEDYRVIADFTYDWEWWRRPDGSFRYVSPSCERITGYPPSAFLDDPDFFLSIVHPGDRAAVAHHLDKFEMALAQSDECRMRIVARDGSIRHIHHCCAPVHDSAGVFIGRRGSNRDITEQSRAEEALRESQEMYRAMFEKNQAVKLLIDPETGTIVDANQAACLFYGYSRDQLLALRISDINTLSPDAIQAEMALAKSENRLNFAFQHRLASGEIRDVDVYSGPVTVHGRCLLHSIIHDITERKRMERELHDSEERFRRIVQTANDGIWQLDAAQLTTFVNKRTADMMGYTPEEMIGVNIAAFMFDEDLADHANRMQERRAGTDDVYERRFRRKDGSTLWAIVSSTTLMSEAGTFDGSFGTLTDITERKRYEQNLADREDELAAIYENAPVIMMLIDAAHKVQKVNRLAAIFAGAEAETMIGQEGGAALRCLYALDAPAGCGSGPYCEQCTVRTTVRTTLETGKNFSQIEASLPFQIDGARQNLTFLLSTTLLTLHKQPMVLVSILDITERKHIEEALRESTQRFQLATASARLGVWEWDIQSDTLIWDDRMYEIYGIGREAFSNILDAWLDRLHPDDAPRALDACQAAVRGEDDYDTEFRILHPDGALRTIKAAGIVQRDDNGTTLRMIGVNSDVTEHRQAEEEIRRNEERLRSLVCILQHCAPGTQEFLDFALHEAIQLTSSRLGYIYFYSEEKKEFVLNTWSKEVMNECVIQEPRTCYELDKTGLWGEAVRQRRPIILNDFDAAHPLKRGYPEGHARLRKYMTTPVFSGERIVAVVGVANKETDYNEMDVLQLTLLMDTVWKVVERRQSEKALSASEAKYRELVENANSSIIRLDAHGNVKFFNEFAQEFFGFSEEEIVGRNVVGTIVPETESSGRDLRAMIADLALHPDNYASNENENMLRDGRRVWVAWSNKPILDDAGRVQEILCVGTDATERRRAQEALLNSEKRFRSYFELPLMGIAITSPEKGWIEVNDALSAMLGYSREELQHMTWVELSHPEDLPADLEQFERVLSGEIDSYILDKRYVRKGGDVIWTNLAVRCVRKQDGTVDYFVVLLQDITGRRGLEQQLQQAQKMEAVGQLAGGIAHDFNNLLQVILGNVNLAQSEHTPGTAVWEDLDEVRKAAQRAAELTRQLLAFSRRQVIQPVDVDVNELIQGVLKMLRRVIGEHIELSFTTRARVCSVHVDKGQIEQVLMNLCVNARDAMPGGGTLTLATENAALDAAYCREHPWAAEGRYVVVSVADTGHGMDAATSVRVFEPFFTTKDVGQGTGLGLATVYGIVKQHHGLVHFHSTPGAGTVFKVYLPLVESTVEEEDHKAAPPVVGGTETILVAEDEPMVLKLVALTLSAAGYTVLTATDGHEALRVFREHEGAVDLVVLDVMMPRMSGREVMDQILATHPGTHFLFASGYSQSAIHSDFVITEGLRLIQKPFHSDLLLQEVRQILDGRAKDGVV